LRHAHKFRLRRSGWVCFVQVGALQKPGVVGPGLAESGVVVTAGSLSPNRPTRLASPDGRCSKAFPGREHWNEAITGDWIALEVVDADTFQPVHRAARETQSQGPLCLA
jgi:hypothetical protein